MKASGDFQVREVILVHDVWGRDLFMTRVEERLRDSLDVEVHSVDLFAGQLPDTPERGALLARDFFASRGLTTFEWPRVNPPHGVAIGFGWGAGVAHWLAHNLALAGAVLFLPTGDHALPPAPAAVSNARVQAHLSVLSEPPAPSQQTGLLRGATSVETYCVGTHLLGGRFYDDTRADFDRALAFRAWRSTLEFLDPVRPTLRDRRLQKFLE